MNHRMARGLSDHAGFMLLVLGLGALDAQAASVDGRLDARISNPGFTIVDNGGAVTLATPDSSEFKTASSSFGGPVLYANTIGIANLSSNAIGIIGEADGLSAQFVGSLRNASAGGYLDYRDLIAVTSSTLAAGTPVQVTFSFAEAHSGTFFHSNVNSTISNNAGATYRFSGNISDPLSSANNIFLDAADHQYRADFGGLSPALSTGIFMPGLPRFDVVFDTYVGGTINFGFRLFAQIGTSVVSTGIGQVDIHAGEALGAVAIAFGASPDNADVTLISDFYPVFFPGSELATLSNASAALVPIPPVGYLSLLCLVWLARQRRGR